MPVLLAARRAEKLSQVAERIRVAGGKAETFSCDVTKPEENHAMVARCIETFGGLHAVFANAGYGLEASVADCTDAQWRDIFETNFFGTLNTIRAALPILTSQRAGHVLICSSCLSKIALPYGSAYSATKAAQEHVGRALRIELAGTGVHASTVHPVGTKTEFFDVANAISPNGRALTKTPEAYMQSPDVVARAVVRCLRSPRPEVWTTWTARLGFALADVSPRLTDTILRRVVAARRD